MSPHVPITCFNHYPHMVSQSGFIYILIHTPCPPVLEFEENSFFFGRTMRHAESWFPDQGSNPCPLQWKHGVLATGLPGKSLEENSKHPDFFFFFKKLIIYFWLCWVFVAAHRLSLVAASGGYSSLRCTGFSLWWLPLLRSTGSRCVGFSSCGSRALERRFSSRGTWV